VYLIALNESYNNLTESIDPMEKVVKDLIFSLNYLFDFPLAMGSVEKFSGEIHPSNHTQIVLDSKIWNRYSCYME